MFVLILTVTADRFDFVLEYPLIMLRKLNWTKAIPDLCSLKFFIHIPRKFPKECCYLILPFNLLFLLKIFLHIFVYLVFFNEGPGKRDLKHDYECQY